MSSAFKASLHGFTERIREIGLGLRFLKGKFEGGKNGRESGWIRLQIRQGAGLASRAQFMIEYILIFYSIKLV